MRKLITIKDDHALKWYVYDESHNKIIREYANQWECFAFIEAYYLDYQRRYKILTK
jgi:hypothetical protein